MLLLADRESHRVARCRFRSSRRRFIEFCPSSKQVGFGEETRVETAAVVRHAVVFKPQEAPATQDTVSGTARTQGRLERVLRAHTGRRLRPSVCPSSGRLRRASRPAAARVDQLAYTRGHLPRKTITTKQLTVVHRITSRAYWLDKRHGLGIGLQRVVS